MSASSNINVTGSFFSRWYSTHGDATSTILPKSSQNVDDLVFDLVKEKDKDAVIAGKFISALEASGLRKSDQRLKELIENLMDENKQQEEAAGDRKDLISIKTMCLDRETFKRVIADNIVLIARAFRHQLIIPEFQTFSAQVKDIFTSCKDHHQGQVATYVPQLARSDPNHWGLSLCTADGQRFSIGDSTVKFTLQSCSNPLNYAVALNELGADIVHQYVGQENSGRMCTELVLDHSNKPHNPMANAGAIVIGSLLMKLIRPEMTMAEKFDYVQEYFKSMAGGEYVGFNNAVFLSEREVSDRSYALAYYMNEHKCFPDGTEVLDCMDLYLQCCSLEADCESAAVMAATLANGGICPISGAMILRPDAVRDTLSLMYSCGMYDYSGQFEFKVGIPAKSCRSGAIISVVPHLLGIATYSPPLDVMGNSARGLKFCEELVQLFNFHKYDNIRHSLNKIDPRRKRHKTKGHNIINLLLSAAQGDVTSLRRHHLSGSDMEACDYDGRTALHVAAAEGHLNCVEYLLQLCKVSPNVRDRWGRLPVDDAERFAHKEVVIFLQKLVAE